MGKIKILGIVIGIIGIILIAISMYITRRVEAGNMQISSAQSKVNMGNELFSLNPATKEVGKGVTGGAQKKINEGKGQVAEYQAIASGLKIGGIVLLILGVGLLFVPRKKRK